MDMEQIRRIQGILQQQSPQEQPKASEAAHGSFKETLEGFLKDVNHLQNNAEEMSESLVKGEVENIHQVMVAMNQAHTSFQLMMEMRNKIMEAYKEIMKMQV
ncbi:flagellar hook-basal body complex protein FliE [bacterium]|nr:flagellar hook-basal body complex protein FliE [bacterium]MBU1651010.1 flagellar hook-basal body complex protein FliE [bacterium]